MTYTELRNFLDGYTDGEGTIQGDPSIIAAEAVAAGLVDDDDNRRRQHPKDRNDATTSETCQRCGSPLDDGLCTDETCPYSDRSQDATFTEG